MKDENELCQRQKTTLTAMSLSLALSIVIMPNAVAEDATAPKAPVAQALSKDDEAVFIRVQKIVVKQMNQKAENVKLESRLVQDLGVDSLDSVEIQLALEKEFQTLIPYEHVERWKSINDIVAYLSKLSDSVKTSPQAKPLETRKTKQVK